MGILIALVTIHSPGEDRAEPLELIVDTGSTLTWIDAKTLSDLGYRPRQTRRFHTIRGEDVWRPVCDAILECEGIRASVGVVFAGRKEAHVLGVTALERMGLEVDPIKPALREARAFLALAVA